MQALRHTLRAGPETSANVLFLAGQMRDGQDQHIVGLCQSIGE